MYIMKSAGLSDTGRLRTNNEDAFAIEGSLLVVADGMGGAAAGEIASSIAVRTITEKLRDISYQSDSQFTEAFRQAILEADKEIKKQTKRNNNLKGMGTTVVTALHINARVLIGNVGDSRAYHITRFSERSGTSSEISNSNIDINAQTAIFQLNDLNTKSASPAYINCITEDDSVVMDLVRKGVIDEEEIRTHPLRNRITKSLGSMVDEDPGFSWVDINDRDVLALCSDGLWELVHEDIILAIVSSSKNMEETCRRLVDAANDAGGTDNITVVSAQFFQE